ncbi:DUF167 domain-containing protein [Novipirellula artificiosorum]|uniref:UPF0235 protein Poly41_20670 n=1 Tax=Novipirellula artificiosorum TaxID=2528016 RepID=A0A5C6DSJ2_9BACT|nr:DUF167 domain-containing protein [Novipirellula artificiosorum]TWU39245.1 hypothetical protein Poly41_20670 [Novipirellula artificiosorum]
MIPIHWSNETCTFDVHVTPKAKRASIGGMHDGALRVAVLQPADKGKANKAVAESIASTLGIAKSRVEIIRGHTSRRKTVSIHDVKRIDLQPLIDLG